MVAGLGLWFVCWGEIEQGWPLDGTCNPGVWH